MLLNIASVQYTALALYATSSRFITVHTLHHAGKLLHAIYFNNDIAVHPAIEY